MRWVFGKIDEVQEGGMLKVGYPLPEAEMTMYLHGLDEGIVPLTEGGCPLMVEDGGMGHGGDQQYQGNGGEGGGGHLEEYWMGEDGECYNEGEEYGGEEDEAEWWGDGNGEEEAGFEGEEGGGDCE